MNCANFLEYNPKNYIIFWNTIHKFTLFNGITVYVNPLVPLCSPFADCEHLGNCAFVVVIISPSIYNSKKSPNLSPKKQLFSFLPFNSPQACGEFGSVFFMMRDALTTLSVPRTSFLCARTIYVIMWTRHWRLVLFASCIW